MHRRTKFLMVLLTAAFALSLAATTANASRSLSIEGETRLTLTGRVTFEGGANIICDTTFTKTVSRVIPKVEGTLIGRVTDIRTANCRTTAERLNTVIILIGPRENGELWRIFYQQFLGTLPSISGLLFELHNTQILIEARLFGVTVGCLYENGRLPRTIGVLATVRNGIIAELRTLPEAEKRETDLIVDLRGFGCPSKGRFAANVAPSQQTRIVLL